MDFTANIVDLMTVVVGLLFALGCVICIRVLVKENDKLRRRVDFLEGACTLYQLELDNKKGNDRVEING